LWCPPCAPSGRDCKLSGQHMLVWRDRWTVVCEWPLRRAVCCAQLLGGGGDWGRRRPLLRVHDRRHSGEFFWGRERCDGRQRKGKGV